LEGGCSPSNTEKEEGHERWVFLFCWKGKETMDLSHFRQRGRSPMSGEERERFCSTSKRKLTLRFTGKRKDAEGKKLVS